MYVFYSVPDVLEKAEKIARKLEVSKVARQSTGWFGSWKKNRENNNKDIILVSGTRKVPAQQLRYEFLTRHLALKYPYVSPDGLATRHLLSILMWNYTPLSYPETKAIIEKTYNHYFSGKS